MQIISPSIKPLNKKYSVIIPAAGYGKRIKSLGPKCLIGLPNNKTIIENSIFNVQKNINFCEIIVVVGYMAQKIKDRFENSNIKIIENKDYETTNVMSSVKIGLEQSSHNDVIILNGDLVFNVNAIKCPFGKDSMVVLEQKFMKDEEVGCVFDGNQISNFMYSLPKKWGQIVYLSETELNLFKRVCDSVDNIEKMFIFEVLNLVMSMGGKFLKYENKKIKICDVDEKKDLEKVPHIIC